MSELFKIMTFTWQVDLGQLLTIVIVGIISFFLKRELNRFDFRLDKHDNVLERLIGDTQRLIGEVGLMQREKKN